MSAAINGFEISTEINILVDPKSKRAKLEPALKENFQQENSLIAYGIGRSSGLCDVGSTHMPEERH